MKYRTFSILTLLALLLVSVVPLTAQDDASESFPVTVTDGLGRELTFEEPPQRVVAIYNGNFGNLATLGVRPVATLANDSMLADPRYFEDGESIPSVAAAEGGIDLEAVAAAEPDLIIAFSIEEVQSMENIAPVYVPLDTNSLEGLYAETRQLGSILGVEDRAEAAISAFQDRLAAYQAITPGDVSILLTSPEEDNLNSMWVRHGDSPDCRLLNEIAICDWENPTDDGGWSFQTTPETLLELNPDFIYYKSPWDGTHQELMDYVRGNPLWAATDAVQNDRLLYVEGYPNPIASSLIATTQLLDVFAPSLYPDLLSDGPLTDEQVQEILADLEASEGTSADGFPVTVVDGLDRELTFEEPPQRVVYLNNGCIRALASLGVRPYALSAWAFAEGEEFGDPTWYPGFLDGVIQLRETELYVADPEAVAEVQPDLIVAYGQDMINQYEGIAPVLSEFEVNTYQDSIENVRSYAQILGLQDEAEATIVRFEDRLAAYRALSPRDVSVLTLGMVSSQEYWVRTKNSTDCSLLNEVALCDWEDPTDGQAWSYQTTNEGVLSLSPDVIYLMNWSSDTTTDELLNAFLADPLIAETNAAQNGRVYNVINYNNATAEGIIPALRLLDTLMPLIYPDIFPDGPLTDEQVQEILAEAETE